MRKFLSACAAALILLPAMSFAVPTVYTYTGPNFTDVENQSALGGYTFDMSFSGSITLTDAILPNSFESFGSGSPLILGFSFSDGRMQYTNVNLGIFGSASFEFQTNDEGQIQSWDLRITLDMPTDGVLFAQAFSKSLCGGPEPCDRVELNDGEVLDTAFVFGSGSWTVTSVPEPSTYALFIAGIALVGFAAKRRIRLPS